MRGFISRFYYWFHLLSFREMIQLVVHKLMERQRLFFLRKRDSRLSSMNTPRSTPKWGAALLKQTPDLSLVDSQDVLRLADLYCGHEFDLLGSGWVKVQPGMRCKGFEGHSYQSDVNVFVLDQKRLFETHSRAREIYLYLPKYYVSIDWQIDFKSGYRWSASQESRSIQFGHRPGVDIKLPWELARFHQGLILAQAFGLTGDAKYLDEFQNQVLDFIAHNPPRYGVNWVCPMDVAIRATNWVMAFDLFLALDAKFSDSFVEILQESLFHHGNHVYQNLEWLPTCRSNHYLSNLAGLVVIGSRLDSHPLADRWLSFALPALLSEFEGQFHEEGSNFEASSCYHRLSSEMLVYAFAVIQGLSPLRLEALKNKRLSWRDRLFLQGAPLRYEIDPFLAQRLFRAALFTLRLTKPNGQITQIGDNDSGRFLKVQPMFRAKSPLIEDHLDHRHLVAAINGLFDHHLLEEFHGPECLEKDLIQIMAGFKVFSWVEPLNPLEPLGDREVWQAKEEEFESVLEHQKLCYNFKFASPLNLDTIEAYAYPEFGVYLFRQNDFFLSLRCGAIGMNGKGAHAHNDQLALELFIQGKDVIRDPGSYVYTASPDLRNAYRSIAAHFAPQIKGQEPEDLSLGLFVMSDRAQTQCLYFDSRHFLGVHHGYGHPVYRLVKIFKEEVVIRDFTTDPRGLSPPTEDLDFSPGYGLKESA